MTESKSKRLANKTLGGKTQDETSSMFLERESDCQRAECLVRNKQTFHQALKFCNRPTERSVVVQSVIETRKLCSSYYKPATSKIASRTNQTKTPYTPYNTLTYLQIRYNGSWIWKAGPQILDLYREFIPLSPPPPPPPSPRLSNNDSSHNKTVS